VFVDPLFNMLDCCCKNTPCRRRSKVQEKSEEMFANELDVFKMLNTLRDMRSMLKNLQNSEHRLLLKFSKDRVINLSDSEEEIKA
jgi:hypothetical protein